MDEIHVHKTKKSICAHFAESPCKKQHVDDKLLDYIIMALQAMPTFGHKSLSSSSDETEYGRVPAADSPL